MKFQKMDLVKVVDYDDAELKDTEMKDFLGAMAIVIETDKSYYPVNIVFFDIKLQRKSLDDGGIWWREEDLDWI